MQTSIQTCIQASIQTNETHKHVWLFIYTYFTSALYAMIGSEGFYALIKRTIESIFPKLDKIDAMIMMILSFYMNRYFRHMFEKKT